MATPIAVTTVQQTIKWGDWFPIVQPVGEIASRLEEGCFQAFEVLQRRLVRASPNNESVTHK